MGDEGDFWREMRPVMKEESDRKKKRNKDNALKQLNNNGVLFQSFNGGIHLVITGSKGLIDYWPTTGKWINRDKKRWGRGIKSLLKQTQRGNKQ